MLSIIVPAFNAQKTLRQCLRSIMLAKEVDDEVIVVNDGSTDQTPAIAAEFNCKLISLYANQGPAAARNVGVRKSNNEILVFIDADVLIEKSHLDQLREYFKTKPEVDAITATLDDQKRGGFFTDYKNLYMNYVFSRCPEQVNFIYGSFCACRRSSFIPWPEQLRIGEDSKWGYQLRTNGKTIHLLKTLAVTHLKDYDLVGLVRNDFRVSRYFSFLFLDHARWKTLYTREKFGHTHKSQKLSLLLAVITIGLLLSRPEFTILPLALWLMINGSFFHKILQKRRSLFVIPAVIWTFIDHLVYSVGVISGVFLLRRRPSEKY